MLAEWERRRKRKLEAVACCGQDYLRGRPRQLIPPLISAQVPSGNLQRSGEQIRKLSSVPVSLFQADSYLDSLHILNVLHGEQQKS